MKHKRLLMLVVLVFISAFLVAQNQVIVPDLSTYDDTSMWSSYNRTATYDAGIHLDSNPGDGVFWFKNVEFENGRIELEVKGKDLPGRSFVGIAFHGLNDTIYDAIYFRPFNFKNPQRKGNSVQYISHPEFPWSRLRNEYPGKYEHAAEPVPDPNDWFHVTLVVKNPVIEVYLNHSKSSTLTVEKISSHEKGLVGFWVGNNSEGVFRNLQIVPE